MSDLKCKCPSCDQSIVVDVSHAGRKLQCPACNVQVTIPMQGDSAGTKPAPAQGPPKPEEVAPQPPPPPKSPPPPPPAAAGNKPAVSPPAIKPVRPPALKADASADVPVPGTKPVQAAVLTSEMKLDIVRSARELISDRSRWMPGRTSLQRFAYTAKMEDGELKSVPVGNPEATHYSLLGAVLLGFQAKNLTQTAAGRAEFLDQEIPGAIREVCPDWERPPGVTSEPSSEPNTQQLGISHEQCLQALDILEKKYQGAGEGSDTTFQTLGASVEELMTRVAKDELITATEVVRAVHRELTELQKRVAELEKVAKEDA